MLIRTKNPKSISRGPRRTILSSLIFPDWSLLSELSIFWFHLTNLRFINSYWFWQSIHKIRFLNKPITSQETNSKSFLCYIWNLRTSSTKWSVEKSNIDSKGINPWSIGTDCLSFLESFRSRLKTEWLASHLLGSLSLRRTIRKSIKSRFGRFKRKERLK